MLISGTSDKIQFRLGSAAATQLPFTANYNNYTTTAVSLVTNNGTSNNTNAVDIVASPSSGQQNELRFCSIYNADTANGTVIVQITDGVNTRVVFRATLIPGDTLQYQLEKGWEVISNTGNKKTYALQVLNNTIRGAVIWKPGATTSTITLTSLAYQYTVLGRAEKAYTSVDLVYAVLGAPTTIAYGELAIYTTPTPTFGGPQTILGRRIGVADVTTPLTTSGPRKTRVNITDTLLPGELLIAVFSTQHTGTLTLRATGMSDSTVTYLSSQMASTVTGGRPSLVPTGPYLTAGTNPVWLIWQGN